jgi:hypothetical protein
MPMVPRYVMFSLFLIIVTNESNKMISLVELNLKYSNFKKDIKQIANSSNESNQTK